MTPLRHGFTLIAALSLVLLPSAHAAKGTGKPAMVDVIVTYDDQPGKAETNQAEALGGKVRRAYGHLPMRAISIPSHALENMTRAKGVKFVAMDAPVEAFSLAARQTARTPTPNTKTFVSPAADVTVAVLDSGVSRHRDLTVSTRVDCLADSSTELMLASSGCVTVSNFKLLSTTYTKTSAESDDPFGHGTHVSGIIGGSGSASYAAYPGVAPGAVIHSVRVLDGQGSGVVSDVLAGLDWVLANAAKRNIRVANLSLGKGIEESAATDPLVVAVEQLWDAGIVVVTSAGNYGRNGHFTITSPGNSRKIITVGSVTDNGTGLDFSDDYVSTFSSRGPTVIDNYLKPDLIAPGNRVIASIPAGSKLKVDLPGRAPKCEICVADYLELSGTSMASGLVSAAAVLMLSKDPGLDPNTVKARLMRSARKVDGDPTATGAGVLDIQAALNEQGHMYTDALSPTLILSADGDAVMVESTELLWGDPAWGSAYIWADGYLWGNVPMGAEGYLWGDGVLADGYLWGNGTLADAFLWADGYLWGDVPLGADGYLWGNLPLGADGYLWGNLPLGADGFLWGRINPLYDIDEPSSVINDD